MTTFADLLEATTLAQFLKASRWVYPLVNAGHVFGIALLVGAVIPMNLAVAGVVRRADPVSTQQLLRPFAVAGLIIASLSGSLLFITQASDYLRNPVFTAKMALFALAVLNASLHLAIVQSATTARALAILSLLMWPTILILGRMVGYVIG